MNIGAMILGVVSTGLLSGGAVAQSRFVEYQPSNDPLAPNQYQAPATTESATFADDAVAPNGEQIRRNEVRDEFLRAVIGLDGTRANALAPNTSVLAPRVPLLTQIGQPTVAIGQTPLGGALVSLQLRPTITGVLREPVESYGGSAFSALTGRALPAGTPVYAVNLGGELNWCAPAVEHTSLFGERNSVCIRKSVLYWRRVTASDLPYITSLPVSIGDAGVSAPVIDLKPVDFDRPFRVAYEVTKWKSRSVLVKSEVLWSGRSYPFGCPFEAARLPGGDALLVAFGQAYRLSPSTDERATMVTSLGADTHPGDMAMQASTQCPAVTASYTSFSTSYRYSSGDHHH